MNTSPTVVPAWLASRDRLFTCLTLLLTFLLPIGGHVLPPVIALVFLVWLIDTRWAERFTRLAKNKLLLPAVLLYVVYALSLLLTDNKASGLFQLETKMGFVLLPLIYGSTAWPAGLTRRKLFTAFIYGCVFAALLCLLNAFYELQLERFLVQRWQRHDVYINYDYFFAARLSFLVHPSYLAMYVCLAMYFVFVKMAEQKERSVILALILLNLLFSAFVFLLASRLGFLTLFLLWMGVVIAFIRRRRLYLQGALMLVGVVGMVVVMYKTSDIIASRFDYAIRSFTAAQVDKTSTESSAVRRLIWGVAADEIKKNWLTGVGAGDVEDVMMERYRSEGMTGALDHKLNTHSQFLQTFMGTGIAGFALLLALLLLPLRWAIRHKDRDYIVFVLLFTVNILVESMLEVQSGVVFFMFFFAVLLAGEGACDKTG